MEIDDNNILNFINENDKVRNYLLFFIGTLITALTFNIFILPNNIVYGVSGIGVILYRLFNIEPFIVILISSLLLLALSFATLGWKQTKKSIIGSIAYPIFVKLTEPIISYVDLGNLEIIVSVVFGAIFSGLGLGLIFKSGFTTGGTDILNQIVSKYFKISMGKAMYFTDGLIMLSGLFTLGLPKFLYSAINIYIISIMTDKVMIGISDSKAFYIITSHETTIKKFLLNKLSHGVTVLDGRGGYTGDNKKVIMCIVPTREYYIVKEAIHKIDPDAFFLVTDSYEVYGGE